VVKIRDTLHDRQRFRSDQRHFFSDGHAVTSDFVAEQVGADGKGERIMANTSIPTQKRMTGMLGHPVAENPIDRMFDAVYSHYGLNWQFWKCDVPSEKELGAAIAGVRALGFAGACITVPYKVAAIPHLDEADADVRAIGAVNWMTIEEGRLTGHNNDGKGVVKAIQKVTPIAGRRVAMLGAGGAGRAMAVELAWAGAAHMTIITRRESQGVEVAELVTRASGVAAEWLPWSDKVVIPDGTEILMNATHLGCVPDLEVVPVDWRSVPVKTTVVDVITNPRLTPFLQMARDKGCTIVDGVEMLVQLAMQIFGAWTGVKPAEAVFQQAVALALSEPALQASAQPA
jgi:shikimate dehydrogenase